MKHVHSFKDFTIKLSIHAIDDSYVVKAIKDGEVIGQLYFEKSKHGPGLLAGSVSVDPNHRRMGIATSMYKFAESETGLKFKRDDRHLTADGRLFRDSFDRRDSF